MITEEQGLKLVLNDEQRMLKDTALQFFRQRAPVSRLRKLRHHQNADGFDRALYREMAELGWTGIVIPEEYGGLGLGLFELCAVLESAGRQLLVEPMLSTAVQGAYALMLGGSDALKSEWLPKIVSGDAIVTVAEYEPSARGCTVHNQATARADGDGFVLNAEKHQVLDAHVADLLLVLCRTSGNKGEGRGLTLFAVDPKAKGVAITRQDRIDDRNAAIVTLSDVAVPKTAVLGEVGGGAELFLQVFDRTCVALSAEMLGGASEAFDTTVEYLKERVQFDVPIGSFQALQHRAARLYMELELARSTVLAAAQAFDTGHSDARKLASLSKYVTAEMFAHVSREAIQMHGGIGMTDEHDIGFYFKRAHAAQQSFGSGAFHKRRWASLSGY
ncbi:MAG: acyl-CoA dehydrogenase [Polyangiales bacterium]